MATKGASYRYGNTRGANHRGEPTKHIGYAWAKDLQVIVMVIREVQIIVANQQNT